MEENTIKVQCPNCKAIAEVPLTQNQGSIVVDLLAAGWGTLEFKYDLEVFRNVWCPECCAKADMAVGGLL